MEDSPGTRVSNNKSLSEQRAFRQKKEETAKQHNLGRASDQYIDALIYYEMGNSEACWNTVAEVTAGLKKIVYQKDKFKALKDNIQIRYKGYGWDSWKTSWSHAGIGKSVPELTQVLKDLIKKQRAEKLKKPDKPMVPIPKRKAMSIMGTPSDQIRRLDEAAAEKTDDFEQRVRYDWMEQEAHGHISIHQAKQLRTAPKVDASLIGTRIEFLFEFETDAAEEKTLHWCRGKINAISDGTWVVTGKTRQT